MALLQQLGITELFEGPGGVVVAARLVGFLRVCGGQLEGTALEHSDVGRFIDALLELNERVPEYIALVVNTDKLSATLEETKRSAWGGKGRRKGDGRGELAVVKSKAGWQDHSNHPIAG